MALHDTTVGSTSTGKVREALGDIRRIVEGLVDALTQLSRELDYAGERTDADQRASQHLALAA